MIQFEKLNVDTIFGMSKYAASGSETSTIAETLSQEQEATDEEFLQMTTTRRCRCNKKSFNTDSNGLSPDNIAGANAQ